MEFVVIGGRPNHFVERYMIKDSEGYIMSSKAYINANPELFNYIGHFRLNSALIHTYEFITPE